MPKVIMVQGTMSSAGKSLVVAGLCRIFKQDGYRVAPFKSQNMALNSFITEEGLEMGRAQVMQAEAAGIHPMVCMNPILLKPTNHTGSQVIVNGEVLGNMSAKDYFAYKTKLIPDIKKAFRKLEAEADIIVIEGVDKLHGTRHQVIPDRIEAGTYISMAAAIGEGVQINNVLYEHLEGFIAKLEEMGVRMTVSEDSVYVEKQHDLKAINIKTAPYPGFATDLQQPITPLLLTAKGRGLIIDTIYEKRVNHVPELAKMAGKISTSANHIAYEGPNQLQGAAVKATDLRAGAALVIAGLLAHGKTEITNVEFILRGYSNIIEKLTSLGADIQLVEE